MPYYRRKRSTKPAPKRKAFPKRSMKMSRRPLLTKEIDDTVVKINPGRDPIVKVKRTTLVNAPNIGSVSGSNGFSITFGTTSFTATYGILFDPAGTYGNNSGNIDNTLPVLAPCQVPGWASFAALYESYKVTRITCTFHASDYGNLATFPPTLYLRHSQDYTTATASTTTIARQRGWIKKTFNEEQPNYVYSWVPKVQDISDNINTMTSASRLPRSMGWTSTSSPAALYGLQIFCINPATVPTISIISCDITYDISFKDTA